MEFYFTRHAASEDGIKLSTEGRLQAAKLGGHFDRVICGPSHCCRETLRRSRITYDSLTVDPNLRERGLAETMTNYYSRIDTFQQFLLTVPRIPKLLIIGVGSFFYYWTARTENDTLPEYARIGVIKMSAD